ncbi:hypothetical protein, partial [Burkholderia pseudomallei]|uniref:hypothetical protein n=1 Tax=Burkholderia pseudomallei TaxID=28450 RepID=UPI001C83524E
MKSEGRRRAASRARCRRGRRHNRIRSGGQKQRAFPEEGPQIADKPSPSGGFLFFNGVMLKTPMPTQHELEMVTLEELVPK